MPTSAALRGRPKSEEKKHAIVEAAVDLFMERGFGRTSMDEIASRAGVSKQTVYSHFGNKDELFRYCVLEKCAEYELTIELIDVDGPLEQVLTDVSTKFMQMLISDDVISVKKMMIAEQSPHLAKLFYDAGPKRMVQMFCQYLECQVARNRLKIDNLEFAARQLLHMLMGETHQRKLLGLTEVPDQQLNQRYIASCVDLFLRAYRVTPEG